MKKSKFLLFISCLICMFNLQSQELIVGKAMVNYVRINTALNVKEPINEKSFHSSIDSVSIYVDGNSIPDLKFIASYQYNRIEKKAIKQIIVLISKKWEIATEELVGKNQQAAFIFKGAENLRKHKFWNSTLPSQKFKQAIVFYNEGWEETTKQIGRIDSCCYIGFRKILYQDTIYGWLQFSTEFPYKIIDYSFTCTVNDSPLPEVKILASDKVCTGKPLQMEFVPDDGVVVGRALVERVFYAEPKHIGAHAFYYIAQNPRGCPSTASVSINVFQSPKVSLEITRENADTIYFKGLPEGGVYSGAGLVNNALDLKRHPQYSVMYLYKDSLGCKDFAVISKYSPGEKGIVTRDKDELVPYPNIWNFMDNLGDTMLHSEGDELAVLIILSPIIFVGGVLLIAIINAQKKARINKNEKKQN